MPKSLHIIGIILAMINTCYARPNIEQLFYADQTEVNFTNTLPSYLKELVTRPIEYSFLRKEKRPQLELHQYQLTSQHWSPVKTLHPAKWQHNVDIFIPDNPFSQRALVIVNNGINHNIKSMDSVPATDFSASTLENIARATNTIVISVDNIPNQYLTYEENGKPLKEDDSVAHSWTLFMEQPDKQQLMPLHIPMAISVSQALTLAQRELKQWNIDNFIVSGISKRGWTTWLAAIADPRIDAIVPFAIDLLGTTATLKHMYQSYGGNWPAVFHPYYQERIDEKIATPEFFKLMQIEDPLQYLGSMYESRLAIPKYIINASGDDFYVPDNSKFYYEKLPGKKSLRVAPNSDHRGIAKFAEQSLTAFIRRFQHSTPLPILHTTLRQQAGKPILTVKFSEKPEKVQRWTAKNPLARDFRHACGISYNASPINLNTKKEIEISLNIPSKGWEATYIEATYADGYVATTQVYITPNDKYPIIAPQANGKMCQTLPGRGLGEK